MKKRIVKSVTFLASLSLCIVSNPISCYAMLEKQSINNSDKLYSITVTDSEWRLLETNEEKVKASQLPEEFIHTASTGDLYDAVLDYPLLVDLTFYEDRALGLERVAKQFNGLKELLKREDLAEVTLEKYRAVKIPTKQKMSAADGKKFYQDMDAFIQSKENREKMDYDFRQMMKSYLAESLFLYQPVSEEYSSVEKRQVVSEVFRKASARGKSSVYDYQPTSDFLDAVSYDSDQDDWEDVVDHQTESLTITSKWGGGPIIRCSAEFVSKYYDGNPTYYARYK